MNDRLMLLCAAAPAAGDRSGLELRCDLRIVEAAEGEGRKNARFSMVAYTGGPMQVGWWEYPVIVDLAGMAVPAQSIPIRLMHDAAQGVGHTEKIRVENGQLLAEGVISRATDAARDVVESAKKGFPWQASIGSRVKKYEFVKAGQSAVVNGRAHAGPVYVMRETVLGEISFVDLGADSGTSAAVAASAPKNATEGEDTTMNPFEKWLTAMGLDPAKLTDEQKAKLQAKFDAEQKPGAGTTDPATPPAPPVTAAAQPGAGATPPPVLEFRAAAAAETERIAAIGKVPGITPEIQAKAIRDGWSQERTELEVLRASRPSAPAVHTGGTAQTTTQLLQCAIEQAVGLGAVEKRFEAPMVEAAHKRFRARLGLGELLLEAARANGFQGSHHDQREVLRFAFQPTLCGGFSTVDIGGILSATANKVLLESFNTVEAVWRAIAAVRPVRDFKTVTSYRLTGALQYEKVGAGGELKHGTLGEESFTNKADTYGLMLAITRQDIINDDLGALNAVPRRLGRGAALKLNDVFWTEFLDNGTFFTTARGNYASGTATALGVDALSAGEQAFLEMKDADSKPIGANPALLLVPPALSALAQQIYKGAELRDNTSSKQYLVVNPHAGKYRVEVSRYLSNTSYTGYSSTAWYLLASPTDLAVIEVAFLNGQEAPTVETADADFNTLGIQMRGYHDFGVKKQDYRGGYKAKGAA